VSPSGNGRALHHVDPRYDVLVRIVEVVSRTPFDTYRRKAVAPGPGSVEEGRSAFRSPAGRRSRGQARGSSAVSLAATAAISAGSPWLGIHGSRHASAGYLGTTWR
jgi:hypothetical protein